MQVLKKDRIVNLHHSVGNILLDAGSLLTIGGKQFLLGSQLSVALSGLVANTLYYVYATLNSGVPQLTISQNVNSAGPTGFGSWKLVGAFYANGGPPALTVSSAQGAIEFGSFINIEGVPTFQAPIPSWFGINTLSDSPPTKATTRDVDVVHWLRVGSKAVCFYQYRHSSLTGAASGTGAYLYLVPPNLTPLAQNFPFQTSPGIGYSGDIIDNHFNAGQVGSSSSGQELAVVSNFRDVALVNGTHGASLLIEGTDYQSSTVRAFAGEASLAASFKVEFNVVGWSDTPLKDL